MEPSTIFPLSKVLVCRESLLTKFRSLTERMFLLRFHYSQNTCEFLICDFFRCIIASSYLACLGILKSMVNAVHLGLGYMLINRSTLLLTCNFLRLNNGKLQKILCRNSTRFIFNKRIWIMVLFYANTLQ